MKYIDLFSGCGGLALGLHKAGFKGVFAIEKNKDAFATLKHNLIDQSNSFDWPDWLSLGQHDINEVIKEHELDLIALRGEIKLLAGGPPCQGFSMAGRRQENDLRNKLIDSYIKFVDLVQPNIIFFENVKGFTIGFKNVDKRGEAYSLYVVNKLKQLGYDVEGKIIDFSEFGVPQKRQRFILVGTKTGRAIKFFDELFASREQFLKSKGIISSKVSLGEALSDLLQKHGQDVCSDSESFMAGKYSVIRTPYQKLMRFGTKLTGKVANSHRFAKHKSLTIARFQEILDNEQRNKNISEQIRKKYNLRKHTIVPLSKEDQAPTLTTLPDDYIHYEEPRILTVREYARVQSFPDTYEFKGGYTTGGDRRKVSVPRYSQIGNAIPPLFAEQAGIVLKEMLS